MTLTVAIHPDDYTAADKPPEYDAASPRWARALKASGYSIKWVDVRRADILDQLKGCEGLMWRWAHFGGMARIAKRLLPVIERELRIAVYPDQNTCWHYDDKIAQAYLLRALGVPVPRTWVWHDRDEAKLWVSGASYPMVLKLATGAGSKNVVLVRTRSDAEAWIDRLFAYSVASLDAAQFAPLPPFRRLRQAVKLVLTGMPRLPPNTGFERQSSYALFQEFLPGNGYDTRVAIVGNRAFAFRRFNRAGDFRASGSGNFDLAPEHVDQGFVRLAFHTAQLVGAQSLAIDGLYRGDDRVVGEISYTYVSGTVHACPGHWELTGDAMTGDLRWVDGHMWAEEAQVADFIVRLRDRIRQPV